MTDHPDAHPIRAALRRGLRGRQGTAIRYAPDLRREVAAFVRAREAEGLSRAAACRLLRLRYPTVQPWLGSQGRESRPSAAQLRRVEIVPASAATPAPVLVTPSGLRVEGLDLEGLARLLRLLP